MALLETARRKELVGELQWQPVCLDDPEPILAELYQFWSEQSQVDRYFRFFEPISLNEVIERYRHAFTHAAMALSLRDNGRLVGFSLGTIDPDDPRWLHLALEIDREYRRKGYSLSSHALMYSYALSHGLSGIKGKILETNIASLASFRRSIQGIPFSVEDRAGICSYTVGRPEALPLTFDLL